VTDWRSYDTIADRYDAVAAPRFRAVAEKMWSLLPAVPMARTLDIGTGTGVVPVAAHQAGRRGYVAVGCDRSTGMLRRARDNAPWAHGVCGDALALPMKDEAFDIVTANFVLSHLRDYGALLREARRILRAGGAAAVSSWAPTTDPFTSAWAEHLAHAIGRREAERAVTAVVPSESDLSDPDRLRGGLEAAGFAVDRIDTLDFTLSPTVAQFIDDRELTPGGRRARDQLGEKAWLRFKVGVRTAFEERFGPSLRYSRRALIAVATKR
jgi:ubiquinone/menaquinone biosynthesis C-methylase UbiE